MGIEDVMFAGKHEDKSFCKDTVLNTINLYFSLFFKQLNSRNSGLERLLSEKELLDLRLKVAISKENYEIAAKIRDEIKKLK